MGRAFHDPLEGDGPTSVVAAPVTGFPTAGRTAAILTTGDATIIDSPNESGGSGAANSGPNVHGDTDYDVAILRIDLNVPAGVNCLSSFDFRYLSEEYPEYVNTTYNDAFIAELDPDDPWTTDGSDIIAPDNFAFDPANSEISINAAGVTSMTAGIAVGTAYDGATPRLRAKTRSPRAAFAVSVDLRPGRRHPRLSSSRRQSRIRQRRQPDGQLHVGGHHARSRDRRRLRAVHAQAHARDPPGCRSRDVRPRLREARKGRRRFDDVVRGRWARRRARRRGRCRR